MNDLPVCEQCGYQLVGLEEHPSGTVLCPECGTGCELAAAPRLRPWPGAMRMAVRLCGPFLANTSALLLLIWAIGLIGVPSLPRAPVGALVLLLIAGLPVTGLVHPGLSALLLAERHAIRPRRTGVFLRIYSAAVGVNLVAFAVGLVLAAMLDAW